MNALLNVPAPAKLNLFLHVTGQRADGLHHLQSAFALVDLSDTLDFELRSHSDISREDMASPSETDALPADDLCVKAARLLQKRTGHPRGAHIRLTKQIPSQAGMGGGSSDAATCLLALNRLWNTRLSRAELLTLAAELGADVPFFVFGQSAWAEGTGDQLQPLELPTQRYLVIKPPMGLATKTIFQDPELKRDTEPATMQGFARHLKSGAKHMFGTNDLQPVAEKLCPSISEGIVNLKDLGLSVRMTGSGSAVFAPLNATNAAPNLPKDWFCCICNSLTEHPLKNWAS